MRVFRKHKKPRKPKKARAIDWKSMRTSKYRDSLDRLFGKENGWRGYKFNNYQND